MGTNEAANVAAGSAFTYDDRIDSMMATIGDEPVMWVNVKSLETSGPYAETNMEDWDKALRDGLRPLPVHARLRLGLRRQGRLVHPRRDPLHVAAATRNAARLIADALLEAFPNDEPLAMADRDDCVISA